jgi:hypothetical protein
MLTQGPPVLVTGSHRSGTSWTAAVLASSPGVALVREPSDTLYRPRWLRRALPHQFHYITHENEDRFAGDFDRMFALRYPLGQFLELQNRAERREFAVQRRRARHARRERHRVVCKDPMGVFSAAWLAERYAARVVVCIRHPAAFVSSLLRLDWRFDFANWLQQPLFMRDCAGRYAEDIERYAGQPAALIDQAIVLWKVIYARVAWYRETFPQWTFVRHEDLAREPARLFPLLFAACDLALTDEARAFLAANSAASNPGDVPTEEWFSIRRNSAVAWRTWRHRLAADQIAYVRERTEEAASVFYGADAWSAPGGLVHDPTP